MWKILSLSHVFLVQMKAVRNLRKRLSSALTQSSALLSACPNFVIGFKGAKGKGMQFSYMSNMTHSQLSQVATALWSHRHHYKTSTYLYCQFASTDIELFQHLAFESCCYLISHTELCRCTFDQSIKAIPISISSWLCAFMIVPFFSIQKKKLCVQYFVPLLNLWALVLAFVKMKFHLNCSIPHLPT